METSQREADWMAAESAAKARFEQNFVGGMDRGTAVNEAVKSAQAVLDQSASREEDFGELFDRLRADLYGRAT